MLYDKLEELMQPIQFGIAVRGGVETVVHILQARLTISSQPVATAVEEASRASVHIVWQEERHADAYSGELPLGDKPGKV